MSKKLSVDLSKGEPNEALKGILNAIKENLGSESGIAIAGESCHDAGAVLNINVTLNVYLPKKLKEITLS